MIIPPATQAQIKAHQKTGRAVFLREHEGRDCANCGGIGHLYFEKSLGGPYRDAPDTGKDQFCGFRDGGWHRLEWLVCPCPVCNEAAADHRIALLWKEAGLEDRERDWRLDYIAGMRDKEEALHSAHDLLALTPRPVGWLTLFGNYGVGKSGLLKSTVAAFIRAGVEARYIRAADYLTHIRATYENGHGSETAVSKEFVNCRVLAIDEVDRVSGTEWARSTLMALMDARYNHRVSTCTLLATNLNPDRMGQEWGYLSSRMRDGERIPVGGIDLRGTSTNGAAPGAAPANGAAPPLADGAPAAGQADGGREGL